MSVPGYFKKSTLLLSVTFFVAAFLGGWAGLYQASGYSAIAGFLLLSLRFYFSITLRGSIFPIVILAAVCAALYFPQAFTKWGSFSLSSLIIPLMQVIMFGMGTAMRMSDFQEIVRRPSGVLIGVIGQFLIMPGIGFLLAYSSNLEPEIAAGIILVGCSPSGVASNVMAYLAKANVALSITLTACTTLLGPFITPLLMKTLAGTYIEINVPTMMFDMARIVLLPIAAGLLFNKFFSGKAVWLDRWMPLISMTGIALIIMVITAAGRDHLLQIGFLLILISIAHNGLGYLLGYGLARLLRQSVRDARTIAIEVGLQNAGLASAIAKGMGLVGTTGLAPGVFGPVMNISGSLLASYWHKKPVMDEPAS